MCLSVRGDIWLWRDRVWSPAFHVSPVRRETRDACPHANTLWVSGRSPGRGRGARQSDIRRVATCTAKGSILWIDDAQFIVEGCPEALKRRGCRTLLGIHGIGGFAMPLRGG